MPNPNVLAVKLLRMSAALVTLVGGDDKHIVAGDLPAGADPANADPWVTVNAEGGTSPSEAPIPTDRMKVICWANENNAACVLSFYEITSRDSSS